MTEEKQFRQIWESLAPAKLFQCFGIAGGPTRLAVAFLAVMAVCLVGWVMDLCTMTVVVNPDPKPIADSAFPSVADFTNATELEVYVAGGEKIKDFIQKYGQKQTDKPAVVSQKKSKSSANSGQDEKQKPAPQSKNKGVFSTFWNFNTARFNGATASLLKRDISNVFLNIWLCVIAILWAIKYHTLYSIVYFSIVAVVFCIAGGAICRTAALQFAGGEKPGLTEALRFGKEKFLALIIAPMIPFGTMILLALVISILGLIGNLPWAGELIVGLALPAALLTGLLLALLLIGTVAGLGLMTPAIAYEGSGATDAISRSFCYVFKQPLPMILYSFIAAVFGTISYFVVRFLTFLVLITTYSALDLGVLSRADGHDKLAAIWARPQFSNLLGENIHASINFSEAIAASLIYLVVFCVVAMLVAFVISFYFSACTIIYSLMRKRIDDVDTDQVYVHLDEVRDD